MHCRLSHSSGTCVDDDSICLPSGPRREPSGVQIPLPVRLNVPAETTSVKLFLNSKMNRSHLQRDEDPPGQAAASVDRRREKGRRLHCPPPRRPQQPRGGGRTAGPPRQGEHGPPERESPDGPPPRRRTATHSNCPSE
jgi:hypothetical protein